MPEPVMQPAPVVTTINPTVKPTAAPVAAAPAEAPEVVQARAALKAVELKQVEIDRKAREQIIERRRWSAEKQTFGEKLKAADEYAAMKRHAEMDPRTTAQKLWGEKWRDRLLEADVNGGAPTAGSVALALEEQEKKFNDRLAARDAEHQKASAAAAQQTDTQARQQLASEADEFWKANGGEYPLFKKLGDASAIAKTLSARIEAEYNRTTQRDEAGNVVRDGKVMTLKEAADDLENAIFAFAEEAAGHEKYAPKLREKLQPAKPSGTVVKPSQSLQQPSSQQQRRTLSNDLTGSTPGRSPPTSDADRLARATAAYNALHQR